MISDRIVSLREVEDAINRLREAKTPLEDGINTPEVNELAPVYAHLIMKHLDEVEVSEDVLKLVR